MRVTNEINFDVGGMQSGNASAVFARDFSTVRTNMGYPTTNSEFKLPVIPVKTSLFS